MERFREKQQQIKQRQAEIIKNYPTLWSKMISEWGSQDPEDRVLLMYSANYIFRTNQLRWMIDPVRLRHRLSGAPDIDVAQSFSDLSFVLLTHQHGDHLDLELIERLKHLPVDWVIPEFLVDRVQEAVHLPEERIIVPTPLKPMNIQGIKITSFEGLHWEKRPEATGATGKGKLHGVPAMGYLVESSGKRWLFPGDTRNYDPSSLLSFGPVDVIFAHLWLGRGRALNDTPPLLNAFCQFHLAIKPRKIILTHLEEFGRQADDYWDIRHVNLVEKWFHEYAPEIEVSAVFLGDNALL